MNKDLYVKLRDLREKLKATPAGGRMPSVCTDAALSEMARLEPKNKDELLCVSGIGKSFVEKYGDVFLDVLTGHRAKKIREGVLCPEVRQTLKNLENRLVNVNRRNRLLYMPKLTAGYSYDPAESGTGAAARTFNARLAEFVKRFEENKRFLIAGPGQDERSESRRKKLTGLIREANRTYRESGENNLYIAYPFVIGKMSGDNFPVRAPLALFPVEIVSEAETVCIRMDTSKDVLFNTSLLLSFNKFNKIGAELPPAVLEEVESSRFFDQVVRFYAEYGIKPIAPAGAELKPFTEYTADKFPRFRSGEFHLENSMVLGKFSMYSSALQRDFKQIIESDSINELLNDLLQRYEDIDMYSDSEELGEKPVCSPYVEKNLNYINDLNISQETALFNISSGNKLVVQGPPGTGKSQTITSMIADFVNKGRNVLMVSQKKAALDVIYSRLGNLSRYAVLLNDVKNKDSFYEQLYRILADEEPAQYSPEEFSGVSESIDADLARLDALADRMFYDTRYGIEMYRIYEEDTHSTLDRSDAQLLNVYAANVPTELFRTGYPRIKSAARLFGNEKLRDSVERFYDIDRAYDWLSRLPGDWSQLQATGKLKSADELVDAYVFYRSGRFFARGPARRQYKKKLKAFLRENFTSVDKTLYKRLYRDPTELYNGLERYTEFVVSKAKYDALTPDARLFFGVCYNLAEAFGATVAETVAHLPEYAAYYYVNEFEVDNRDVMTVLDNYGVILADLAVNFARKKELSRNRLKSVLADSVKTDILASKRAGEMQRIIDGKRKWSIPRFISKFSFELFKGVRVWLMTPEVVSEVLPLETGLFDLLIFDEASQIYIEKGVPSIARAKKVVIAGDHKQLRPSSLGFGRTDYDDAEDESNAALEEESLLDLARFKYPEILLDYHYRSKYEELIAFSNYAFYKGRLNVSPNVEQPASPPITVKYVPDGRWQERRNYAEAKQVVRLLTAFFNKRRGNETVGVITFNSAQRDLILDLIDELCLVNPAFANTYKRETQRTENGEDVGLFVKNIENVQGDERDVVIFSLAYAKGANGKVVRNFGWLNQTGGENRLNVAISRAKKKIVLVTSIRPEELKVDDLTGEGPRIFKKYLEYAYCVSDGNTDGARDVLLSFGSAAPVETAEDADAFVDEVYARLRREGLSVVRGVGIGGYKIDLAIRDEAGRFVLGIECDGSLYPASRSARERDVHRRRFLESRGWKLYRLWSSNWWRESDAEIGRIRREAGIG